MILMLIIMFAPILALPLFSVMRFPYALFLYIVLVMISGWMHWIMHRCKHLRALSGLEAMIGESAVVLKDLDPEGKVNFRGEVWNAVTRGEKIPLGHQVTILGANGLQLIVKAVDADAPT